MAAAVKPLHYQLNIHISNGPGGYIEYSVIRFTWKDRDDDTLQVGSIAQYWQKVLPESVVEKEDRLSLGYGVAGLVSGVVVARKVMDLEKRLMRLEKMFAITNDNDSED